MLTEFAAAKVNLYLHVTGRRADGYHLLDSLAAFPAIGDRLSAETDHALSLTLTGPFGGDLAAEPDNLVLRAARALAAHCGVAAGARLVLEKNLPIASGIGGGSADAAAALRLLCRLWSVHPGEAALAEIAAGLGADIPVCLASRPARMQGIGEILNAAPELPAFGMVLINPGLAVPTPAVFKARTGPFSPEAALPQSWPGLAGMTEGLAHTSNDLQAAAIALCPPIAGVLEALTATPSCRLARMSGSGATCFGLFSDADAAAQAGGAVAKAGMVGLGRCCGAYSLTNRNE